MAVFPLVRHLPSARTGSTGWAALALLWAFVVLSRGFDPAAKSYASARQTIAAVMRHQEEPWLTTAITFFTFLPRFIMRRVTVTITACSTHASIITFQDGVKPGLLGRISRSPLSRWHAFGIIPDG
ncbi:hypothetical protein PR202_ga10524 [Eleusine coracana subsp. coracana]|uniref:Uncharacterized protein n=1 Tax=Eleusine coracana subsp. coracana TaxID=191504 RepID=A0AAV5C6Y5_ELECO|nr:hypothetical protein PR202_ga10524 [Eleusine coracana subsp. coracana]